MSQTTKIASGISLVLLFFLIIFPLTTLGAGGTCSTTTPTLCPGNHMLRVNPGGLNGCTITSSGIRQFLGENITFTTLSSAFVLVVASLGGGINITNAEVTFGIGVTRTFSNTQTFPCGQSLNCLSNFCLQTVQTISFTAANNPGAVVLPTTFISSVFGQATVGTRFNYFPFIILPGVIPNAVQVTMAADPTSIISLIEAAPGPQLGITG